MFRLLRQVAAAAIGPTVPLAGCDVRVPGSLPIRLSVVAGNIRMQRLIDHAVGPGGVVADVGANIGYNTVYAARRVGPQGRVVAVEPTVDNLAVLEHNVAANGLRQVTIAPVAAGRGRGEREFYVRGDTSAVNSFYPVSCYAEVTETVRVPVRPLDELVAGDADLVKIDVEGAELDVLGGMPRLLRSTNLTLIVEWHPVLQEAAGYASEALPLALLREGFSLTAVSHLGRVRLTETAVAAMARRLRASRRPVELVAHR